jgi:hypothetical protein
MKKTQKVQKQGQSIFEIIKKISAEKPEGRVLNTLGGADKKGVDIKVS